MTEARKTRPWWLNTGCLVAAAVVLIMLIGAGWIYFGVYQGRSISRITGVPVKVALPDCIKSPDQIISISFHRESNGETIKDVTYVCDGRIFSHEYNDFGVFQGSVEWTYTK